MAMNILGKRSFATAFPSSPSGYAKRIRLSTGRFPRRRPILRRPRRAIGSHVEYKYVDVTLSPGTTRTDTTGDVILLNGIARGDDVSDRIGRKVIIKSLEARFYAYVTAGTGVDQSNRVMLVYDKQPSGAAPNITDVLVSVSTTALKNENNSQRFTILYDQIYYLNGSGESDSAKIWHTYRRLNFPVQFNAGYAATVADIQSGAIWLMVMGSEARGATASAINGRTRIKFIDQ